MVELSDQSRVAIVAQEGVFTYGDLDLASRRVAAALLGGRRDLDEARVAFLEPPGFGYPAVQKGIWRAGGVAVPLCVSHPPAEIEYVIRDSGAAWVVANALHGDALAPVAAAAGVRLVTTTELSLAAPAHPLPEVPAARRAMIVYTSGTTGRPKGVVTTHANIAAQLGAQVSAWKWVEGDRILHVLPLHHIHGIINGLHAPLAVGAACELLPAFNAEQTWARLASGDITVFTAVPTIYQRLIERWEAAPLEVQKAWTAGAGGLRLMMSGSAALPTRVLERWRQITRHTLLERYGMTEIGMALSNPLEGERRPGFVGTPLPGVRVRLVDERGSVVSPGTPGEVEVSGPAVFLEYWQRAVDTQNAFHDGWFRTGDIAVVEGGAYRILGRQSTDIIKTGGYKVSALEIEDVLGTHPAIAECAVVGVHDPAWGERVSAAVELRPGSTLTLDELKRWAHTRLAPYKIPKALKEVRALPRNTLGKVMKQQVGLLFQTSREDH